MLDHGAVSRNRPKARGKEKSGKKREGADSQNGGHFAAQAEPAPAFAHGSRALAGAAHRDGKATAPRPAKRSEKFRLRLTTAELDGLHDLAARTGIPRSRLARKALRELITGSVDLLNREQQAVLELARQMRLIGINLNQIARQMNRRDSASRNLGGSIEELREALTESEYTWRRLVATARARTVPEYGRD